MGPDDVDDLRLQEIGVLVLVDEDVPEPVGVVRGRLGGLAKQVEPELQKVVVVEHVGRALLLLVALRKGGDPVDQALVLREIARDRLRVGGPGVAREGDQVVERPGARVGLVLEEGLVEAVDGVAQEVLGFVGVHDRE